MAKKTNHIAGILRAGKTRADIEAEFEGATSATRDELSVKWSHANRDRQNLIEAALRDGVKADLIQFATGIAEETNYGTRLPGA